jgi:serine-type D-Ala-D-Ala endopeptidase (penicillin-binding protein 7)
MLRLILGVLGLLFVQNFAHSAPPPKIISPHAVIYDLDAEEVLYAKSADSSRPIASLTKLMTAMVALDQEDYSQWHVEVTSSDIDRLKGTSSRLPVGAEISFEEALHLALTASDNRAAAALARTSPSGQNEFIEAMNRKAHDLGMEKTRFVEPTGLSPQNKASAMDIVIMAKTALAYDTIRQFSAAPAGHLDYAGQAVNFKNTNVLVGRTDWQIGISKTGFTREAGKCLVMSMEAAGRNLLVVFLGAPSSEARLLDATNAKRWVEGKPPLQPQPKKKPPQKKKKKTAR